MVFLGTLILEILSFDAITAASTQTAINLVIVSLAVRFVVVNVELGGLEWLATGCAYEARLMVASSKTAIGT